MTVIDRQQQVADPPDPPRRKDRTHWLYIAVIAAVLVGIAVGILAPDVGKSVGVLGTMFVALIKMMIAPVIFCTIVLGIGSVRKAATVGKVGGLAFVYFLVMSTFALAIGLVVGNLIHPGSGMHLSESAAGKGAELAEKAHESGGLMDFVQHIIPDTLLSALTGRQCAASTFRRAARRIRAAGHGHLGGADPARHRAPAEARVQDPRDDPVAGADRRVRCDRQRRRADRLDRGDATADADARLLHHLRAVRIRRARLDPARGGRGVDLQAGALPGPRVPADLLDVVVGVRAAAADRQDGAPGRRPQHRRCRRPDRLLVQPRRHRDLPDDGVAVHRRRAGQPAFGRPSRSACWCS